MFCPYVRKTYTRLVIIGYNQEQQENGSVLYEQYTNQECKQAECGAWHRGRCRYNENND